MRRTVVRLARHAVALAVRVGGVGQIVAHEQIGPAVAIVVDERRRRAPAGVVGPALLRHVGEGAVAIVAEQLIASERRHVEIDAAVVVVVAGRDAHPVSGRVQPAGVGHVGEPQRARAVGVHLQIVPEQSSLQRQRTLRRKQRLLQFLAGAEHLPLRNEHIEIAVVVVIEQRHARAHVLGVIERAGHPVEVHEVEAGRRGAVDKPLGRWRCGRRRLAGRRTVVDLWRRRSPAGGTDSRYGSRRAARQDSALRDVIPNDSTGE